MCKEHRFDCQCGCISKVEYFERLPAVAARQQALIDKLVRALKELTEACMASDFNEHWDAFKNAEQLITKTEERS